MVCVGECVRRVCCMCVCVCVDTSTHFSLGSPSSSKDLAVAGTQRSNRVSPFTFTFTTPLLVPHASCSLHDEPSLPSPLLACWLAAAARQLAFISLGAVFAAAPRAATLCRVSACT